MSKLSQLHAELEERAGELGFCGVEDALEQGWQVDYESAKLRPPIVQPTLNEIKELERGRELAHQEWLARRSAVLADLYALHKHFNEHDETQYATIVNETIKFLEEGEI